MDNKTVWAERIADELRHRERQQAAALPDTADNLLIKQILTQQHVWVNVARLRNLRQLALIYADTPGAFVECGVAAGASLAMMAAHAGNGRTVWGFDSFEPLPALVAEDEGDGTEWVGVKNSGPDGEAAVANLFQKVGVPMDQVRLVKGWFADTLPHIIDQVGPIAILRLDADFYEATRYALEMLYDQIQPGGVVIIDDYGSFAGCRRAVDEFRARRGITGDLRMSADNIEATWFP